MMPMYAWCWATKMRRHNLGCLRSREEIVLSWDVLHIVQHAMRRSPRGPRTIDIYCPCFDIFRPETRVNISAGSYAT